MQPLQVRPWPTCRERGPSLGSSAWLHSGWSGGHLGRLGRDSDDGACPRNAWAEGAERDRRDLLRAGGIEPSLFSWRRCCRS